MNPQTSNQQPKCSASPDFSFNGWTHGYLELGNNDDDNGEPDQYDNGVGFVVLHRNIDTYYVDSDQYDDGVGYVVLHSIPPWPEGPLRGAERERGQQGGAQGRHHRADSLFTTSTTLDTTQPPAPDKKSCSFPQHQPSTNSCPHFSS